MISTHAAIHRQASFTLSYHRFVHVPTCSPPSRLYVPHKKLWHRSPIVSGEVSSKHMTKRASSTISRHDELWRSVASAVRSLDQTLRFSVDRTPIAPRATYKSDSVSILYFAMEWTPRKQCLLSIDVPLICQSYLHH